MKEKNGIRVFFGIPAYGGMIMASFHRSYLELQAHGLIQKACHVDGDSLVSRARNNLTAEFLKSDCTHLLFIDTDIIFHAADVKKLITGATAGMPIVAGLYPKKQKELAWVMNTMEGEETMPNGYRRVKYAGTGFMLIARSVFERMKNAYPEIAYTTDYGEAGDKREIRHDFWKVGVHRGKDTPATEPGRYLSEDWYFCQMMEDLGMPVYMDMTIHTQHVGQVAYPLEEVPLNNPAGNDTNTETKPATAEIAAPESVRPHCQTIFNGEYEFESSFKDGDSILDIGANVGAFAAWAKCKWPNSPIECYEPIKSNFKFLEKNLAAHEGATLHNQAVRTEASAGVMFAGKYNCGECSFYDLGEQLTDCRESVECVSASGIESAAFVKIDTEGCELEIIKALDLSKTRAVVLEWHSADDKKAIKTKMLADGFRVVLDNDRSSERGVLAFIKI